MIGLMNHRSIVASALASAFALGLVAPAAAQDKAKEKCYGIAKAGQNDCASLNGSHSCAGASRDEKSPLDWKYVAKGTCKDLEGLSEAEAKALQAKKG
jgi:uncharacterized membrane protein